MSFDLIFLQVDALLTINRLKLVVFVAYRTALHPLRAFPGPLAAKVTLGYPAWYALQKRLHLVIYQNHQKYGSVVRIGPNRLVFNSVSALKGIYTPTCIISRQF